MRSTASTPEEYVASLPVDRREAVTKLREIINKEIPNGFEEIISYGHIGWVVPHSLYPKGYHCDPKLPLPFMSIASQKNFVAVYHMGIYADPKLMAWFTTEWPRHTSKKLDIGKSCIRIKKPEDVPIALFGELAKKMTPKEWIAMYEAAFTWK